MICRNCGTPIAPEDNYCKKCGTKLIAKDQENNTRNNNQSYKGWFIAFGLVGFMVVCFFVGTLLAK
ncbi:zinc-ribbon domain-containing protein [Haloimpatiens sp. FM7330]|uniref:zinc-ribbon domain-containing protein n=1 Tax=Haloimpatiens sp. FM7330 TaxID=3298610 RepID=UPI00363B4EFF